MTFLCRLSFLLFVSFQLQAFAQPRVIIIDSNFKELKRAAHRLRMPAEQLKNARQALQEATELVSKIEPYPIDQISSLASSWQRLNSSKATVTIESFIQDLRLQATEPKDFLTYQRATSAAMSLMQLKNSSEPEKTQEMIESWPNPPESLGDTALNYRKGLENQIKSQEIRRLAASDPEKAYSIMSQSGGVGSNYAAAAQIARSFMNKGKKDEALKIIDQAIANMYQSANEPAGIAEYLSFVQIAANIDAKRAGAVLTQAITQMSKNPQTNSTAVKLTVGNKSADLTSAETNALMLLRTMSSSKPEIAAQVLNSLPDLKTKLDGIGGLDNAFSGSASLGYGPGGTTMSFGSSFSDINKLTKDLQGKSQTNQPMVRQKLQELAKTPDNIDALVNLAMSAASRDPDLADMALEIAQPLLQQVESLQKRASILQTMIRTYRQADGEVDAELLKTGYIIADQMRQEQSDNAKKMGITGSLMAPSMTAADRLETFLIGETARESFDAAISFVRSMEVSPVKLANMVQIVQALSQSNY